MCICIKYVSANIGNITNDNSIKKASLVVVQLITLNIETSYRLVNWNITSFTALSDVMQMITIQHIITCFYIGIFTPGITIALPGIEDILPSNSSAK